MLQITDLRADLSGTLCLQPATFADVSVCCAVVSRCWPGGTVLPPGGRRTPRASRPETDVRVTVRSPVSAARSAVSACNVESATA